LPEEFVVAVETTSPLLNADTLAPEMPVVPFVTDPEFEPAAGNATLTVVAAPTVTVCPGVTVAPKPEADTTTS
jgi:hypothetical protein